MEWMGLPGSFIPEVSLSAPARQWTTWSEEDLYEYSLVVRPTPDIDRKIDEARSSFEEGGIGDKSGLDHSVIRVANLIARPDMESTISRWMRKICGLRTGFQVTFNNYGGIPPHTVYLRVMDHSPFHQLVKELKVVDEFVRSNGCPATEFFLRPFISVARKMRSDKYENVIRFFSQQTFSESFWVKELILLKRKDPFEEYKVFEVFGLQPQAMSTIN